MSALGKFLKSSRVNAGLSQGDVSKKLGYTTPQFVSNWERGLSSPPIPVLKTLAKMYGVDIHVFYEVYLSEKYAEIKKEVYASLFGDPSKKIKKSSKKSLKKPISEEESKEKHI